MEINTSQSYHDNITKLIEDYYKASKGEKPSIEERNRASEELVDKYVEEFGKRPPDAVLSRLSTYILLDDLSDPYPDKMSRDEYPIMSYGQTGRYFARNTRLSDEPFPQDEVIGRTKVVIDDGASDGGFILNPETSEQRTRDWRLFIDEVLSERERTLVEMMYGDGASQAEIAEELGISTRWVREIHARILDKLREIIERDVEFGENTSG